MRRFIAAVSLLLVPSVASAGARQDINDIRHGRTDSRHEFLGWTDAGEAVSRRLVCSEGGELTCRASIDVLDTEGSERTTILWTNGDSLYEEATPEDPKGPISTAEAMSFIRAEKRTRAGLGSLRRGTAVSDPAQVFGPIGGEPTQVYLRTSNDPHNEALRLHIAVRGPRGTSVDIETLDNSPWHVDGQRVLDANIGPDGDAVWVAMHYEDGVMCWDGEDLEFSTASRGAVRAKLANAAGLRAYNDGDLDEARSLFATATAEDPTYAWGWFNDAAVASRDGDVQVAADSLAHAIELDPTMHDRACNDPDFDTLVSTAVGTTVLDCGYTEGC